MLPPAARLKETRSFRDAARRGRRATSSALTVHLLSPPADGARTDVPARVGFVVARDVGGAVVRNRVRRRLRHQMRDRLDQLPPGVLVLVRALPSAASATYAELGGDLDRCLGRLLSLGQPAGLRP